MEPTASSSISTDSSDDVVNEEATIEALISQVDRDGVNEIIRIQKKSLERFEKTNEMLATCCILLERRMEKARKEMMAGGELIMQIKVDLATTFQKIRRLKKLLTQPDATSANT